jgi:hypothetical protein
MPSLPYDLSISAARAGAAAPVRYRTDQSGPLGRGPDLQRGRQWSVTATSADTGPRRPFGPVNARSYSPGQCHDRCHRLSRHGRIGWTRG